MKVKIFTPTKMVLIAIFVGAFFVSCGGKQTNKIYVPGYEIVFSTKIIEEGKLIQTDSILLRVLNNNNKTQTIFNQRSVEWIYPSESTNKSEITGISEEKDGKKVFLHPPREHYLKFTELAPFPDINLPLGNSTSKSYTLISHGFGDWNGKKIEKLDTLNKNDTTYLKIDTLNLKCYLKKGASHKTPLGKISTEFYFNKKYGFVKFKYLIHDQRKAIIITAIRFKGLK